MRVGIDASNIRSGGGLTHLREVLAAANPLKHGIDQVMVWASRSTAEQMPTRTWLDVVQVPALDGSLLRRQMWQRTALPSLARASSDLLFAPGGTTAATSVPLVAMSQNLLPFESRERQRYGLSIKRLRLTFLKTAQTRTFRRADGLIFLTQYARDVVCREVGGVARHVVVPHGVSDRFRRRPADELRGPTAQSPLRLLYVSVVALYKHQWHVAEAVARLREEGIPVHLDLVGPAEPQALGLLRAKLATLGDKATAVTYHGPLPFEALHEVYASADAFVFASSCENLPNIVMEAMAAGLPIASSNRGPMPEILGDAGVYFDPEEPRSIANALRSLVLDPDLRRRCAAAASKRAQPFTWERCADDTFAFLAEVARGAAGPRQPVRTGDKV